MRLLCSLILLLTIFSSGCALLVVGGAAAVGTYTYSAGQLKCVYNVGLDAMFKATIAGCESLQLPVLGPEKGLSTASVSTKDGERDVWINLQAQTSTTTEVAIRVGYFGDEVVSQRIHDAIRAKL